MKKIHMIAAGVVAAGVGLFAWRRFGRSAALGEVRNDAAGPRLPAMPEMPRMPSMPSMPGMPTMRSGAAPNMPQIGPQAPAGLFAGMW
jgi:hypothetical protein